MSTSHEATLNLNTRVTFQLLAMLVTPLLCMIILWYKVDSMQRDVQRSWTVTQQQFWAERLKNSNPALVVPRVEEVAETVNGRH